MSQRVSKLTSLPSQCLSLGESCWCYFRDNALHLVCNLFDTFQRLNALTVSVGAWDQALKGCLLQTKHGSHEAFRKLPL